MTRDAEDRELRLARDAGEIEALILAGSWERVVASGRTVEPSKALAGVPQPRDPRRPPAGSGGPACR